MKNLERGQFVDISLLDSLLSLFAYQTQIELSSNQVVTRKGNKHPTITPYETYETKDDFINIAVGSEPLWDNFCRAIDREDLIVHPSFETNAKRVENRGALEKILVPIIKGKQSAEWIKNFKKYDIPSGKINTVQEALKLKVVKEREMVYTMNHPITGKLRVVGNPIKLSGECINCFLPPPLLGQHTNEVLKGLGYSKSEIERFRRLSVIK